MTGHLPPPIELAPSDADGWRVSRRQVLRWMGAAGAATVVPLALGACEPTPDPLPPDPSMRGLGFVGGPEVEIGQGGWCWFQSPRASFGPNQVLWLGSSVSQTDTELDGAVQVTAFDAAAMQVIEQRTVAQTREDDHTSPSVVAVGDEVQIAWALHQQVNYLDVGDTSVGAPFAPTRIHRPGSLHPPGRGMSYCSVHVVAGNRWILYRGEEFSWNLLTSIDGGEWTARGLVIRPSDIGDRPYLHAASDGTKLHIVVTDANPAEYPGTSVFAGTIDDSFTVKRFDGTVVGTVGSGAPSPDQLTQLFGGAAGADETGDTDAWLCDLKVVDNAPTGALSVREPWPEGADSVGNYRHRYLWIRRRSSGWVVEPLCWAGGELCVTQPDYAGLVAQDPSEPKRVVVSTNVHPVTEVPLVSGADGQVHFELFQGFRIGEGQWEWTAITADSVEDNMRPTIASGGPVKALAWLRGAYWSWTDFDTRVVVRRASEPPPASSTAPSSTEPAPPSTTEVPETTTTAPTTTAPTPATPPGTTPTVPEISSPTTTTPPSSSTTVAISPAAG